MPEKPKIPVVDDNALNTKLCRAILNKLKAMKGRQYKKEFGQFLSIAEGSLFEMLALCELFRRRKLFKKADVTRIRGLAENLDCKLRGLINTLQKRQS